MEIQMEKPPGDMSLSALTERCSQEMNKFRRKEPNDDQYCLEIVRRALARGQDEAWDVLYAQFSETVRLWFRGHECREAALRYDLSEKSYVDDTFKRFWQWTRNQQLEFPSLAAALRSLYLCLNSSIMDTLRAYSRPKEEPIPEFDTLNDPKIQVEDVYLQDEWWKVVESLLENEREGRVLFLLYNSGLKPREIMQFCPGEFESEQEIYRLTRNALDRLRRNKDKIRWRLSDNEG